MLRREHSLPRVVARSVGSLPWNSLKSGFVSDPRVARVLPDLKLPCGAFHPCPWEKLKWKSREASRTDATDRCVLGNDVSTQRVVIRKNEGCPPRETGGTHTFRYQSSSNRSIQRWGRSCGVRFLFPVPVRKSRILSWSARSSDPFFFIIKWAKENPRRSFNFPSPDSYESCEVKQTHTTQARRQSPFVLFERRRNRL